MAYVMSFFRQVNNSVQRCRFRIDGKQVLKRNVIIFMVGNTSQLTGGIQLFPEATPFDGSLDLLIGAPQGISGWWRVVKNVVLNWAAQHARVFQRQTLRSPVAQAGGVGDGRRPRSRGAALGSSRSYRKPLRLSPASPVP
ncbi:hypothetical protein [Mobiluncus curtisii]|uniref:YegS/DAGK C-terminal domain-containing protein n=1 Tax=Mobiluncus curtisii TaxID=2051 RepID=A0A2X3BIY0_9ACTO|nr:hypothetical protein [Mobiluncus curtisii]SQC01647.1 Uncharacterised protein [Mobiluncus curtisii]